MGTLFSRFRKSKSAERLLEDIQANIDKLENERQYTLQREKIIIGKLLLYSVLLYVIAAAVFYFCFFPASLWDRLFYIIPLLIFPIIIFIVKQLVTWMYKRDIVRSKNKLVNLREQKKKILDDVMNTETYKKAKEILDKYAPEQTKKAELLVPLKKSTAPESKEKSATDVKQPGKPEVSPILPSSTPNNLITRKNMTASMPNLNSSNAGFFQRLPPQRRLMRPILPQQFGYVEKIIEVFTGDGPSNRYALICQNCSSHNGMALREEFLFISFRCAYCGFPNPSRQVRPKDMEGIFTPQRSRSPSIQRDQLGEEQEEIIPDSKETNIKEIEATDEEAPEKEYEDVKEVNIILRKKVDDISEQSTAGISEDNKKTL